MVDLFSSIPVRAEGVTGSFVQTPMQVRARDLFTGIFHIRGQRQLVLLFLQGRPLNLYELVGGRWEQLPQIRWDENDLCHCLSLCRTGVLCSTAAVAPWSHVRAPGSGPRLKP